MGCVYYEAPDAIVLIDPLVPTEHVEATRFWEALDRDVKRAGLPVHVYITVFWHARGADEIVRRYGGSLHATSRARAANERRTGVAPDVFRPGDPLPGGIEALASGRSTEVVYWIPEHGHSCPATSSSATTTTACACAHGRGSRPASTTPRCARP